MNILITAGGTSEKIDEVRYITNHSTGRLGKTIAELFATQAQATITYICGANAVLPTGKNINILQINSVDELLQTLTNYLTTEAFDAVIHSMAVSDYRPKQAFSEENLIQQISQALKQQPELIKDEGLLQQALKEQLQQLTTPQINQAKKMSSAHERLFLSLEKTPKIIGEIKQLQPDTILVGFKLLVGVTKDELQQVGYRLLQKNNCQFVLANDLNNITTDQHQGLLIDERGNYQTCQTKHEIAQTILTEILKKIGEKS